MAASAQSVGSLIIDLRANVASLQADMQAMKDTVAKSSREMHSAMQSDITETRHTLALMREDFGVGLPRELRSAVASVEVLRDAILGLQSVFFGIAFFNVAEEFAKKFGLISEDTGEAAKRAAELAKAETEYLEAIKRGNEAHEERMRLIGLIGKSQDDIFKSNFDHNTQLINQQKQIVEGMIAQINAKAALLALDIQGIRNAGAGSEAAQTDPGEDIKKLQAGFNAFVNTLQKPLIEAQNKLQELEDQGLAMTKQHEEDKRQEYKRTSDEQQKELEQAKIKLKEIHQASIEILDPIERANAKWKERADIQRAILEQHPELQEHAVGVYSAQVLQLKNLQLQLDKQINAELHTANTELEKMIKAQGLTPIAGITQSLQGGTPQLHPDLQGAAVDRFRAGFKDAAEQGKLLTKAMDDLLTPVDKFRIEQEEIEILKEKFKDYPEVIKALNVEILKANPEFQKLMQASAEFGKDLSNELDSLLTKSETFGQFLQNIAKDIEQIALKALLLKPLENFFSGGSNGTGGIFGFLGAIFGGAHAYGGSAASGQVSLVGEDGPELILPNSNSTVIPAGSMGGVTNVFNIDARGAAPGSEAAIIRGLHRALEENVRKSTAAMIDYQRRR